jgi:DNA (cytosine-5)-methyltransferase 1
MYDLDSYPFYHVSLYSGAGGELLTSQWFKRWITVCYVEREKYATDVIKERIKDGYLCDAPIWSNMHTFTKRNNQLRRFFRQLRSIRRQLVITGGFPCQPFSSAGRRNSNADERNGWPDTIRVIRELRPAVVFLENVDDLLWAVDKTADVPVGYFGTILSDLAQSGYDVRWRVLSAAEVGAAHQRDRLWIVATNTYGQ